MPQILKCLHARSAGTARTYVAQCLHAVVARGNADLSLRNTLTGMLSS